MYKKNALNNIEAILKIIARCIFYNFYIEKFAMIVE